MSTKMQEIELLVGMLDVEEAALAFDGWLEIDSRISLGLGDTITWSYNHVINKHRITITCPNGDVIVGGEIDADRARDEFEHTYAYA